MEFIIAKSLIVLDIDDVKVRCYGAMAKWHNQEYGTSLSLASFTTYNFWEVFGCSIDEGRRRCVRFFHSPDGMCVPTLPGTREALRRLAERYHLVSVTGRPYDAAEATRRLMERRRVYEYIAEVHHTNFFANNSTRTSKGDICKALGAKFIIDDHDGYVPEFADHPTQILLFGKYPWNCRAKECVRVQNWHDVCALLL